MEDGATMRATLLGTRIAAAIHGANNQSSNNQIGNSRLFVSPPGEIKRGGGMHAEQCGRAL